ncbi:MAG: SatD family protein [Bacillota bacterium]
MSAVTVITADVVQSRRAGQQVAQLSDLLAGLDHPSLLAGFSVSRGDEIQGVCKGILEAPELVRRLRFACIPLRLRIGIGVGFLDSGANSNDPWRMNGSAFVRAREALDSVKKARQPRTAIRSGDSRADTVASAILHLMDVIENRWTKQQWKAVHAYERFGTYEAAGEHLGIRLQTVQEHCLLANWPAIEQAEETLKGLAVLGLVACQTPLD